MADDRIHVMPDSLANLIAAGEVVERPASVIKELVENSIDAKATHVYVDIEKGGFGSLTVKDNGVGMGKDDARLCLLRHASSKIKTAYDLFDIKTMGFRGEAIPSIVSVSQFKMDTSDGIEGTHVEATGAQSPSFSPSALRQGTTITVSDLFYNTPARLKYLKSEGFERAKCLDVLEHLALGFPSVSFDVRTDGKPVFSTTGRGNVIEAIQRLYGNDVAREVTKVTITPSLGFSVDAYLAKPEINYSNKFQILTFLNSRYVYSYRLTKAVEEGYRDYLAPLRYPFALLRIEADPSLVDVNVHPSKKEVRISGEDGLAAAIKAMVLDFLGKGKPVYTDRSAQAFFARKDGGQGLSLSAVKPVAEPASSVSATVLDGFDKPAPEAGAPLFESVTSSAFLGNDSQEIAKAMAKAQNQAQASQGLSDRSLDLPLGEAPAKPNPYAELCPLGQIDKTYIVCDSPEGLAIMDQHAAAERVNFEIFEDKFKANVQVVTPLEPVILDFPASVVTAFDDSKKSILKAMGFDVEPFGNSSLKLMTLPSFLTDKNYVGVIKDLIVSVAQGRKEDPLDLMRKAVATLACKASVRAGDTLSPTEQVALIQNLGKCRNPANCPHGRPTVIKITISDLERLFKRTGF